MKAVAKTKSVLQDILDAAKRIVALVADLNVATQATAVAGIVAPIIAAITGNPFSAATLAVDLGAAGAVAALIENVFAVRKTKAARAAAARSRRRAR
jgi:hypothetical protein